MLTNFLKITFRNLARNKVYYLVNILGLSLALACCIVAFINYKYSADYDSVHEKGDDIYKIHFRKEASGAATKWGVSPLAIGPGLSENVVGIEAVVRYNQQQLPIKYGEKITNKRIGYADPALFDLFTFNQLLGSPSIKGLGEIVLAQETAELYFGDENPLGKTVELVDDKGKSHPFIVSGVLQKIPQNSSLNFEVVINFENYLAFRDIKATDWDAFIAATFLYIPNASQVPSVSHVLQDFVAIQNEARPDFKVSAYYLQQYATLAHEVSDVYANYLAEAMDPVSYWAPFILALLMLLIATFNYTNTAIALSGKRLKEIGIRKVIGGSKRMLLAQFLMENLVICFLSILLSLVFATYLVPAYGAMWNGQVLKLDFVNDPEIYAYLFGLLILAGLLCGAYPSFYASGFQPSKILRGSVKIGTTSKLSKTLLSLQIAFTLLTLVSSAAFISNAEYQKNMDMGFQRDGIVVVSVDGREEADRFIQKVEQNPNISEVLPTSYHVGSSVYARTLEGRDKSMEAMMMDVTPQYLEFMDIKMVAGKDFAPELWDSQIDQSIIINESFQKAMGWTEPLGERLVINDTTRLSVIGVTEDFYYQGLWEPVEPMAIRLSEKEDARFVLVKSEDQKEAYDDLEEAWLSLFPTRPFEGFFHEESFSGEIMVNKNIVIIFSFMGILAVLLSAIGLYTMVSLTLLRRVKEIGIRKVLGAKILNLVVMINLDFVLIVGAGVVTGIGLGYLMSSFLLEQIFAYYLPVSLFSMVVPSLLIVGIMAVTSSIRIYHTAQQNPVKSLRYE